MPGTMQRLICVTAVLLGVAGSSVAQQKESYEVKKVKVRDGIELSYIETGKGTPVIFIHGTLGDLYMWTEYVREFSKGYRAIAYSRRYNYPNKNSAQPDHSTAVEAEDLAAFLKKLDLPKAHIVGYSYGGYTALHLAVKHPELVRTLILAEPPLVPWLAKLPGARGIEGRRLIAASDKEFLVPAREAISKGKVDSAVAMFIDHVIAEGAYDRLKPDAKASINRNILEFVAETQSTEKFAPLTRAEVAGINVPTLMLSGANSTPSLRMTDDELEKTLPAKLCQRVVIQDATHAMWYEKPEECRKLVLDFISNK